MYILKKIRRIIAFFLDLVAFILSKFKRMDFPAAYDWRMKFDMLLGLYEKETTALCRNIIKPGMKVIDVGAHVGYYSILFSKLVGVNGKVLSFEPSKKNFELLKKNTKRLKNVEVFSLAVSDKVGNIDFYEGDKTGSHSIFPAEFRKIHKKVSSITLDSFIAANPNRPPKIDLIKIDIEGGEPYAIAGMKDLVQLNKNIALILEFCPKNLNFSNIAPDEFLESLHRLGFQIFIIRSGGRLERVRPNDRVELPIKKKKRHNLWIEPKEQYVNLFCKK